MLSLRGFSVVVAAGLLPVYAGCGHSGTPVSAAPVVDSGDTVSSDEVVDEVASNEGMNQQSADAAWRTTLVEKWRTDLETDRTHQLRIIELDHRESVDLLLGEVFSQADVSAEAIDEHLAAVRVRYETPMVRIRHIYFRADADSPGALRSTKLAMAREVRDRSLAGDSFADLAREFSDSADASSGGLVDRLRPGMADALLEQAAFALSEGEISEIIETPSGYHVVLLEHRYPPPSFDERPYRDAAPELLRKQEEERLRAKLLGRLRTNEKYEKRWNVENGLTPRPFDGAVLEIGDFIFTEDDLERVRRESDPALLRWDQRVAFLDDLLDRELLYAESLRRFQPSEAELHDRRARATDEALAEGALQRETSEAREEVPMSVLEAFVADPASPLVVETTFHTRVIFIADGESPYGAMIAAEQVMGRLGAGGDFAALARQVSDGPNADRGGDLGYLDNVGLFTLAPELARMASSLEIGEVSDSLRITASRLVSTIHALRGGFLIVKLVDRRPPRRLSAGTDEDLVRERFWERHGAGIMAERRDGLLAEQGFSRVR